MAMKKNTAATVTFALVSASDGSAVTSGTASAFVTGDAGTQGAASNSPAHEGNGQWSLSLTQAEMNADNVGVLITHASAIPVNLDIHTDAKLVSDLNDITAASVWAVATRTLSAFSFEVTTDAASRTASQADVSALATAAELAKVPKDGETHVYTNTDTSAEATVQITASP